MPAVLHEANGRGHMEVQGVQEGAGWRRLYPQVSRFHLCAPSLSFLEHDAFSLVVCSSLLD